MKQQGIVLLAAGLILVVVLILTGYVEKAENMQSMQEILSQEEPLTEDQIRNIDQNIVDEYYNRENSESDDGRGYNFTVIINDVIQR